MIWKREHVRGDIFLSVDSINMLDLLVVDTDDGHVEFLHP